MSTSISVTVVTETATGPFGCPRCGNPATEVSLGQWRFNLTAQTLSFGIKNTGLVDATLTNATIFGDPSNAGFGGRVGIDLQGIYLARNETAYATSPALSGLTVGDRITVKVGTTAGTFTISTQTVSP